MLEGMKAKRAMEEKGQGFEGCIGKQVLTSQFYFIGNGCYPPSPSLPPPPGYFYRSFLLFYFAPFNSLLIQSLFSVALVVFILSFSLSHSFKVSHGSSLVSYGTGTRLSWVHTHISQICSHLHGGTFKDQSTKIDVHWMFSITSFSSKLNIKFHCCLLNL